MLPEFKTAKKGSALYLSIVIVVILLAIALGLGTILVGQLRMMREVGASVIAFYAADTGMEHSLYNLFKESGDGEVLGSVGQAGYEADYEVFYEDEGCGLEKWTSIGNYRGATRRAILNPRTDFYFAVATNNVCVIAGVEETINDQIAAAFFTEEACDVNFSFTDLPDINVLPISSCLEADFDPICIRDLIYTISEEAGEGDYELIIEAEASPVLRKQLTITIDVAATCD